MSGSNSSARNAEPLGLTVHSLSAPDLSDPAQSERQRTRGGRLKMLLVLLVCAAPVIASYLTYFVIRPQGRTNYGELILPTRAMPDLNLRTLQGQAVPVATLRQQWLLLVVSPAACAAACEQNLLLQRQLREMLGREKERVDKVFLVTDPAALSAPLLAALQAAPAVTVLRADPARVAAWLAPAAGQALEEHVYLVDPMGEWMMRFPPRPEPSRVQRDLERLLRASGSWDQPGR